MDNGRIISEIKDFIFSNLHIKGRDITEIEQYPNSMTINTKWGDKYLIDIQELPEPNKSDDYSNEFELLTDSNY